MIEVEQFETSKIEDMYTQAQGKAKGSVKFMIAGTAASMSEALSALGALSAGVLPVFSQADVAAVADAPSVPAEVKEAAAGAIVEQAPAAEEKPKRGRKAKAVETPQAITDLVDAVTAEIEKEDSAKVAAPVKVDVKAAVADAKAAAADAVMKSKASTKKETAEVSDEPPAGLVECVSFRKVMEWMIANDVKTATEITALCEKYRESVPVLARQSGPFADRVERALSMLEISK